MDSTFFVTETEDDDIIADYPATTPPGWSIHPTVRNLLNRTVPPKEKFSDYLDVGESTIVESFENFEEYDHYLKLHPELFI